MKYLLLLLLCCSLLGAQERPMHSDEAMNPIAERYVKLVLAVGVHDADYVDAYYGPPAWQEEAKAQKLPLAAIADSAKGLVARLKEIELDGAEEIVTLRHQYLVKQLGALNARVEMLGGRKFTFDEEAKALYDAEPPSYPESHFQEIIKELEAILPPGEGSAAERVEAYRSKFVIPNKKLDTVFTAAIEECRKRTKNYIPLPDSESFTVEYVKDKPWSGYNWYKGNSHSLIQVNTELPIFIDRAVDLAAHEGYPGHHVYNVLLENHLMRGRGWMEFSVYPLFSPQSLIAEGTANYGIEVAFPGAERVAFERDVLFPLAGLDPQAAEQYYHVQELVGKLAYAGNEAARRYLNGAITRDEAAAWLTAYALMSPERAQQRTRFIDTYRSYVINYNLGKDLVKEYIEKRGGTSGKPATRWEEFRTLISSPRLPSGLK